MRRMRASELQGWCLAQGGAIEEFPFGPEHSVFKVGGKMFALSALWMVTRWFSPVEKSIPEKKIGSR